MKVFLVFIVFSLAKTVRLQSFCTTPNGELAKCIPIKECQIFVDAFKDNIPPPIRIADFIRNSTCSFDKGPVVCCGNFNHLREYTPPTADPRKHKNFHLLPQNCGIQEVDERVLVGETEAQLEEFPWMALLEYNRTDTPRKYNFLFGGSLINNQYVLTVAHSSDREIPFSVRLGDHDLTSEIDCRKKIEGSQNYELCINSYEDIPIERITRHVGYNDKEKKNDIALIRLARPATISTNIRPICLPLNGEETPTGRGMFVSGWGWALFLDGYAYTMSKIKRKAQLPIVALDKCTEMYSKRFINITKQHLCAGGEGDVDTCQGDGGNALVTPKVDSVPPQWFMEGIVSFNVECEGKFPSVFTRVSKYLNWILDHIEEE